VRKLLIEKAVEGFFSRNPKRVKEASGLIEKIAGDFNRSRRYLKELQEVLEEAKAVYGKRGLSAGDPLPKAIEVRLYLVKGTAAYGKENLGEPEVLKILVDLLVQRTKNLKDLERATLLLEAFVGFAARRRKG